MVVEGEKLRGGKWKSDPAFAPLSRITLRCDGTRRGETVAMVRKEEEKEEKPQEPSPLH